MKKKNKGRASGKRNQREAIKKAARGQINRAARLSAVRMRKAAMLTKSLDMTEGGPGRMDLESEVSLPRCGGVGACCKNQMVRVNPGDIWRIMHNERVQKMFGIEFTMDLFGREKKGGLLHYWLDQRTGLPVCAVRRDIQDDEETERCVFLEIDKGGKHTCILGEDRPTTCQANPIGRVGKKNEKGELIGWEYILKDDLCQKCTQREEENYTITIEDWLDKQGMEERYNLSNMFLGFIGWMAREVKAQEMRELGAMLVFDFDRFPLEIAKISSEETKQNRPEFPEQVMVSARMLLDGIMVGTAPAEEQVDDKVISNP